MTQKSLYDNYNNKKKSSEIAKKNEKPYVIFNIPKERNIIINIR